MSARRHLRQFTGPALAKICFPIGGMGSGMFALGGSGSLSAFSLQHRPQLFHEPIVFAALSVRRSNQTVVSRVLEGPVPQWKFFYPWDRAWDSTGMGAGSMHHSFGLPRFESALFSSTFPFASIDLYEKEFPVSVSLTGWSPFIPGDADATSLPVGAIEYEFQNQNDEELDLVFSFHAKNFLAAGNEGQSASGLPGGFIIRQAGLGEDPASEAAFAAVVDEESVRTDLKWFRGGWFDALSSIWKTINAGKMVSQTAPSEGEPSPGGSLYLPLKLKRGEKRKVRLLLSWFVPYSKLRECHPVTASNLACDPKQCFRPWYAQRFSNVESIVLHWRKDVEKLRNSTEAFTECFYDTTLPAEVVEAVAANLSILKSPTILREWGGNIWAWEGCRDEYGSCPGSCTHVWNYAQAICHLFPSLERGLREVEFNFSQDYNGHQNFRAALPLALVPPEFHAAADGQLGGIIKVYREWRISGDTGWLRGLWPKVRKSLDFCIETWDPDRLGLPIEGHHNTYDIEFWGFNGMCGSIYLSALQAAVRMGVAAGDKMDGYEALLTKGKTLLEDELFNGEYFFQKVEWRNLRSSEAVTKPGVNSPSDYSSEARELLETEGPKYQYGQGCLSDGIIGEWLGWNAGLSPVVDPVKTRQHLQSVFHYNFRKTLLKHANPQRPAYAFGDEAGLLLCTWPKGGQLSLPFPYSEEVWTGIEYQVASHLISLGDVEQGLEMVKAVRNRYDGEIRNPYAEMECGHWYARALASYALIAALSGARYDAVDKILYLNPKIRGDFRAFFAGDGIFGSVGVESGEPFFEARSGSMDIKELQYQPFLS